MESTTSLSDAEKQRHNELYHRACNLQSGLIMFDMVPRKRLWFIGRRRLRESIKLFQQVLEIQPDNWQSMVFIGKAYQSLGEQSEALTWFLRAYDHVPEEIAVALEIGATAGRVGRHDVAIRVTESAIRNNPGRAGLHSNLGISHLISGNTAEARRAFETAIELEPEEDVNRRLLALTVKVERKRCPVPKNESDIARYI